MTGMYILIGKNPTAISDMLIWGKYMLNADRRIAISEHKDSTVSTVFLGIDRNYHDGEPLLFETIVWGGEFHEEMRRYSTWEQAEQGHKKMVDKVTAAMGA